MELDLDAFTSGGDNNYDDEDHLLNDDGIPHRTVDDILNESSSSDDSSSTSLSDRSYLPRPRFPSDYRSSVSVMACSPKTLSSDDARVFVDENTRLTSSSEVHRFKLSSISWEREKEKEKERESRLGEFSSSGLLDHRRNALFGFGGGVRSNAKKPGAALAAAAAASRSIPTPHAAAIKSRRANAIEEEELASKSSQGGGISEDGRDGGADDFGRLGLGLGLGLGLPNPNPNPNPNLNDDVSGLAEISPFQSDGKLGDSQSNVSGEFDRNIAEESSHIYMEEHVSERVDDDESSVRGAYNFEQVSSSTTHVEQNTKTSSFNKEEEDDWNFNECSTIPVSIDVIEDDKQLVRSHELHSDVNSLVVFTDDTKTTEHTKQKGIPSPPGPGSDKGSSKAEEDLTIPMYETPQDDLEQKVVMPYPKDQEELSLAEEDDNAGSSTSDVTDLVEERILQWESERSSKRAEKRRSRSSMKPLELAEELEKKHSFTGLHLEEGAAAQPMRLEGVRRGSTALGYFDTDANNTITRTISSQAFRRDHGSPQVVAVHLNFIAVGMSKGLVVIMPSKYSPHCADNLDAKMLMLGLQGDRSHAPVTSMCFNQQGDLLFAGYGDGHITVWDVQKGSAVKVISGSHEAPVVHMLYLGQDSQVARQFKVVSGDSKGSVFLITFSVVPWLNRFSFKTACLLDGKTTGRVLCASPLLSNECSIGVSLSSQENTTGSTSALGSMMGGVVGGDAGWKFFAEDSSLVEEGVVIFVTHQTALVARVTPEVKVYSQLPKPEGVREGSMPYTAWKCMTQSRDSSNENLPVEASEKVSLLAIAWDRKVQVSKLVKSELKICGKWTLESSAIGVAWLDDQMLVVLTLNGQLCLFAKDGTVIHQTNFSVDGFGGDDLIAYHTYFMNIFGNPEKAYHNCVAVRGATIYILGPMHLVVSRLLPWKERIQVLRKAGDWMGALNMAMTLYDGQAHGVIDLPKTLDAVQEAIMPYLIELLLSYVDEVFSYISVAFCNQIEKLEQLGDSKSTSSSVHSDIKEQFTRVGGVAVEFCVHIKRTDILFDEILSKFVDVKHKDTFLELLEPYILKDMLGSLPPEIMQALVEHYSTKGWLQRVEQCVLHMDISSLDFNQVVRLCREHRLYGALVYLFNRGLDDFKAPLEELLVVLRNSPRESAAVLGYRMLVYLKYCFSGLAFPPGHGTLSPTRLPSLRIELVQFLLEDSSSPNSWVVSCLSSAGAYLNLYHLLELDTEATLDVLTCAFVEDEVLKSDHSLYDSPNANVEDKKEYGSTAESLNLLVQRTVNALVHVLDTVNSLKDWSTSSDNIGVEYWPSKNDVGHIFEFIAYNVSCKRANISNNILSQIFEYFTSEINLPPSVPRQNIETSKRREKQVLSLLEVVPERYWDASYVLRLCEKAQFYQVCGLIHAIRHQYLAALDSYMKDVDEPVHAFSFINDTLLLLNEPELGAFQSAVISQIPDLVCLCREGAFFLIIDHFAGENQQIFSELHSHPKSLFLYLKTVVEVHLSGILNFSCLKKDHIVYFPGGRWSDRVEAYFRRISDFPKILHNNPVHLTDEMTELYLELLCKHERNSVLKFLETFESYRVEHCLRLCQEYGIIDAAAFLLERVGDVGSALVLTLSGLNDKFVVLDTAVGNVVCDAGMEHFSTILKREVSEVRDILHACIGMCQRNTPRLDPEESESLWFRLLDSFNAGFVSLCWIHIIIKYLKEKITSEC
ncbi:uncharacterized protein LOC132304565 isoform X2 [Cornus florida]|uniref:uncharacterized protein LOC132304565 isoform X2 n=1 Tax=Cornus florida TaxID=4283 RepID=UPI0028997F3C|nr:uncharacterized protein LOC132304565 isoform X2 [Cornus florida]